MKKLTIALIVMTSTNSFAGTGSTLDFMLTAHFGFTHGCDGINDGSLDKLRVTACQLGSSMKKAGITSIQFNKILDAASENMTEFNSICGK